MWKEGNECRQRVKKSDCGRKAGEGVVSGERVGLSDKFKIPPSSQCIRWPFLANLHDEILQRYFLEDKEE